VATVDGRDVDWARTSMIETLSTVVDRDWTARAGCLDWSCWRTAEHIAHDLLAYAAQVTSQAPDRYLPFDLVAKPNTTPDQLLEIMATCAGLLRKALDTADPAMRAWHWGPTDVTGFAAMGVSEILVHTWDILQGLGLRWEAPVDLSQRVVNRLVRDPPAGRPFDVLLWATGRTSLDASHPRQKSWTYKASTG
jgi:uncharacterized protein (TIGR03083 family)